MGNVLDLEFFEAAKLLRWIHSPAFVFLAEADESWELGTTAPRKTYNLLLTISHGQLNERHVKKISFGKFPTSYCCHHHPLFCILSSTHFFFNLSSTLCPPGIFGTRQTPLPFRQRDAGGRRFKQMEPCDFRATKQPLRRRYISSQIEVSTAIPLQTTLSQIFNENLSSQCHGNGRWSVSHVVEWKLGTPLEH